MQNSDAREKVVQDRILLQCSLGALDSNHDIFFELQIDTPENRTATLELFRTLLCNEARLLANPLLLCKNPQSDVPIKLNYKVKTHFTSSKINEDLLANGVVKMEI